MEVLVRISDAGDEVAALHHWLDNERELRGGIRRPATPAGPTELGSVPDVVVVTIATSQAAQILTRSLITWMQTRKKTVKLHVQTGGRVVTLDIESADDVTALLERILRVDE